MTQKLAIVTGGGQGIGRGIALRLAQEGLTVVIADVDTNAGREAAEALSAEGTVWFQPADVTNEDSVRDLIRAVLERHGRLDALVNNAAIANPVSGPVEQLSLEEWDRRLRSNLTSAFLTTKHAAPALRQSRGAIVNIASTRALQSEPDCEAYAASKGGILALTHALAVSLGPEVRVNAISPGWIDVTAWKKSADRQPAELTETDHRQHPSGRVGQPEDVAGLVKYLISAEAGFITGQNFVIDGGMTRKMIYED